MEEQTQHGDHYMQPKKDRDRENTSLLKEVTNLTAITPCHRPIDRLGSSVQTTTSPIKIIIVLVH